MKSQPISKKLKDLSAAYAGKYLRVDPEYQRGIQWTKAQKQGLIDSLLKGYQIPIFYIHRDEKPNPYTGTAETTAWIVDGQQRLAAIHEYLQNEFSMPDTQKAKAGATISASTWAGKKFQELEPAMRDYLLNHDLQVVEMIADKNEVRELFIRLQAGTPLTAQEKRDAWPGDFTIFVIRHAGKPSHKDSHPHPYFEQFKKSGKKISIADEYHYVDGRADIRKFFAGLAMTVMQRESNGIDFVDVKGNAINDFYIKNFEIPNGDPGAQRVITLLDMIAALPKFGDFKTGAPMTFQMASHFALLVDTLDQGNYTNDWKQDIVSAFLDFKAQVAEARHRYRESKETLPHYEKFAQLLSGSGSDTAEIIRQRHNFMLSELYQKIKIIPKDEKRAFDSLEREIIYGRDRGRCQNPRCTREERRVVFHDAEIHHIVEHCAGGETIFKNGILLCPECHAQRDEMRKLAPVFQKYIERIYSGKIVYDPETIAGPDSDSEQIQITIKWGELDVDRPEQIICGNNDVATVVEFLRLLLEEFKEPMRNQLIKIPVVRYPLSSNPDEDFINQSKGEPYSCKQIPGTNLYFCGQSNREEKLKRLKDFLSRLELPDGSPLPENAINISIKRKAAMLADILGS